MRDVLGESSFFEEKKVPKIGPKIHASHAGNLRRRGGVPCKPSRPTPAYHSPSQTCPQIPLQTKPMQTKQPEHLQTYPCAAREDYVHAHGPEGTVADDGKRWTLYVACWTTGILAHNMIRFFRVWGEGSGESVWAGIGPVVIRRRMTGSAHALYVAYGAGG